MTAPSSARSSSDRPRDAPCGIWNSAIFLSPYAVLNLLVYRSAVAAEPTSFGSISSTGSQATRIAPTDLAKGTAYRAPACTPSRRPHRSAHGPRADRQNCENLQVGRIDALALAQGVLLETRPRPMSIFDFYQAKSVPTPSARAHFLPMQRALLPRLGRPRRQASPDQPGDEFADGPAGAAAVLHRRPGSIAGTGGEGYAVATLRGHAGPLRGAEVADEAAHMPFTSSTLSTRRRRCSRARSRRMRWAARKVSWRRERRSGVHGSGARRDVPSHLAPGPRCQRQLSFSISLIVSSTANGLWSQKTKKPARLQYQYNF